MKERSLGRAYLAWLVLSIGGAIAISGLSPEATTRLGVVALLGLELALREPLLGAAARLPARVRFVLVASLLACVVEGLHMGSKPVFDVLRVTGTTPHAEALERYAIDLAFTLPAYLVIFAVMERFARRYRYSRLEYALAMGLGQTLGDGGIFFFAAAPWMLAFLPYPMTNYHAINVLPYLAIEPTLDPGRAASRRRFLAIPALIATYLACGALIKLVGRALGLEA